MAAEYRTMVLRGLDPIEDRRRARQKAVRDRHLLRDVARDAFESRKAEVKGDGIAGRWSSPLKLHILPKLGKMPVTAITQVDIRDALEPVGRLARRRCLRLPDRLERVAELNRWLHKGNAFRRGGKRHSIRRNKTPERV
jgi:hypothetical protein